MSFLFLSAAARSAGASGWLLLGVYLGNFLLEEPVLEELFLLFV
jgi:hypothetical protein